MKEPILEMRGITKKFGSVTANKDVDLTLYPGRFMHSSGKMVQVKYPDEYFEWNLQAEPRENLL